MYFELPQPSNLTSRLDRKHRDVVKLAPLWTIVTNLCRFNKWGVKHFFSKNLYQCNIDTVCSKNKHPEIFLGKAKNRSLEG